MSFGKFKNRDKLLVQLADALSGKEHPNFSHGFDEDKLMNIYVVFTENGEFCFTGDDEEAEDHSMPLTKALSCLADDRAFSGTSSYSDLENADNLVLETD